MAGRRTATHRRAQVTQPCTPADGGREGPEDEARSSGPARPGRSRSRGAPPEPSA
jgi:hypothetical protein